MGYNKKHRNWKWKPARAEPALSSNYTLDSDVVAFMLIDKTTGNAIEDCHEIKTAMELFYKLDNEDLILDAYDIITGSSVLLEETLEIVDHIRLKRNYGYSL